jgi:acyl-coenzyme A thioesterase PaaI-like protein
MSEVLSSKAPRQIKAGEFFLTEFLTISPFARFLNIQPQFAADRVFLKLCFAEHHIGNPMIRALHGGIVASLCELSASSMFALQTGATSMPKTLSHNVSYQRQSPRIAMRKPRSSASADEPRPCPRRRGRRT